MPQLCTALSASLTLEEDSRMPIYEFDCKECGQRFERYVRPTAAHPDEVIACPSCHGVHLQQLLSSFAVSSEGTRQLNRERSRKLGGKNQQEEEHAALEAALHHHHEP